MPLLVVVVAALITVILSTFLPVSIAFQRHNCCSSHRDNSQEGFIESVGRANTRADYTLLNKKRTKILTDNGVAANSRAFQFATMTFALGLVPSQISASSRPRQQHPKQYRDYCKSSLPLCQSSKLVQSTRESSSSTLLGNRDSIAGDEVVYSPPLTTISNITELKHKCNDSNHSLDLRSSIVKGVDGDSSGLSPTTPPPNAQQHHQGPIEHSTQRNSKANKMKKINHFTNKKHNKKKSKKSIILRTGNLPDVYWRAIPQTHLRHHPQFQPLPPPALIDHLPTLEHVRYFRQESWQWDALHMGRCTTSQTAAALGFLEPKAARFLGIPRSLWKGGRGAWERLSGECIIGQDGDCESFDINSNVTKNIRAESREEDSRLKELEQFLCEGKGLSHAMKKELEEEWEEEKETISKLWIPASKLRSDSATRARTNAYNGHHKQQQQQFIQPPSNHHYQRKPYPFIAKYLPKVTHDYLFQQKQLLDNEQRRRSHTPSPVATRMRWGNAQEATSILTALNYFCGLDNRTTIHEVGMCGAGFDGYGYDHGSSSNSEANNIVNDYGLNGLKIGASPDAIICHGNGTVEVLEVKNHCPFVWNTPTKKRNYRKSKNSIQHVNGHVHSNHQLQPSHSNAATKSGKERNKHYFMIRDFHLEPTIPPMYIPQLMMEMLCLGDAVDLNNSENNTQSGYTTEHQYEPHRKGICQSAVMVRQTATKGAILLRLHRDEEWMKEMKYWLGKFKSKFVDTGIPPPENFFWDGEVDEEYEHEDFDEGNSVTECVDFVEKTLDHGEAAWVDVEDCGDKSTTDNRLRQRYLKFLKRTKQLSESVELVDIIPHGRVQRAVLEKGGGGEIPLFLDKVEEEKERL